MPTLLAHVGHHGAEPVDVARLEPDPPREAGVEEVVVRRGQVRAEGLRDDQVAEVQAGRVGPIRATSYCGAVPTTVASSLRSVPSSRSRATSMRSAFSTT